MEIILLSHRALVYYNITTQKQTTLDTFYGDIDTTRLQFDVDTEKSI